MMTLLIGISLMGCSTERIKYVPLPVVPIPANLTANCIPPLPEQPFTYGASVIWNDRLLETIENCNLDKQAIRSIEASRHSAHQ
ncbi:Rz1-like lysis system protein LysC [Edaphovirga cremea]|uniref:Rz1-like lysis system protein LysC n=1 Tax=Edaphovirga cremea TaxID=2267246 RepID=UPI000DEEE948